MKKKYVSKKIAALSLCSALVLTVPAFTYATEGNDAVAVTQDESTGTETVVEDPTGQLTIENNVVTGCASDAVNVVIPDGVTAIGEGAFAGKLYLESVEIPSSVTSIGNQAFYNCMNLKSVEIPSSVTSIAEYAFWNCYNLEDVEIPSGLTSIGYGAFCFCSTIESIEIPGGVENLSDYAFYNCSGLKKVVISNGVTSIGSNAFCCNTNLESIEIPNSVTSIGSYAFYACSNLETIEISDNVADIDKVAFDGTLWLANEREVAEDSLVIVNNILIDGQMAKGEIKIPEDVTSIAGNAFYGNTELKGIEIPATVTSMGRDAFSNCSNLENVKISSGLTCIEAFVFNGCDALESIEIPNSVTAINFYAFYGCNNLENIVIPSSVTSIGRAAFWETKWLEDMQASATDSLVIVNGILIDGQKAEGEIIIPSGVTSIGIGAFSNCSNIESVEIPSGVTSIGVDAFFASGLKTIIIPSSVTSIGDGAFAAEWDKSDEESTGLLDVTLYVVENSYAHTYAEENGLNYELVAEEGSDDNNQDGSNDANNDSDNAGSSGTTASTDPVYTTDEFKELLAENSTADVVIKSNDSITITFAKGTMQAVDGMEKYDFTATITKDFTDAKVPASINKDEFVAKVTYNYSGKLPAEASIKILLGKDYVGKDLFYSLLNKDGSLTETQKVKVDADGSLTVKQSHCSEYVITTTNPSAEQSDNKGETTDNKAENTDNKTDASDSAVEPAETADVSAIPMMVLLICGTAMVVLAGKKRKLA